MRFAIVGHPVAHSKSPRMHRAAYAAMGLDHTYDAIDVEPTDFERVFEWIRAGKLDGANVTVPNKLAAFERADRVMPSAAAVGACNTLVVAEGGLIEAHNTDVSAVAEELRLLAPERSTRDWAESGAIVLGSGGAARAVVAALADDLGVATIVVRARAFAGPGGTARAKETFARVLEHAPRVELIGEGLRPGGADSSATTLVQATSLGMDGVGHGELAQAAVDFGACPSSAVAMEIVYAPRVTPWLESAEHRGLRAVGGLGMLARQGAEAFKLWLGVSPPLDVMMAALDAS